MSETARTWHAVDVTVEPDAVEAIESAFNELDALGTEVDGLRKRRGEPLCVTGFFDMPPDDRERDAAVKRSLNIYGFEPGVVKGTATRTVEETDWLAEWKKHWRPTGIGKFVIAPPWDDISPSGKIVIKIEPNMAFGTGTHETTKLCLKAISERYEASMTLLDVGTGTGILAIAAAKLGGSEIFACDTDAGSVRIARENAILNGAGNRINFVEGPIGDDTPRYDFVAANLTLDVIAPLLPLLISKTRQTLLLSGILVTQEGELCGQLDSLGIAGTQIEYDGEWLSAVISVSQASPVS